MSGKAMGDFMVGEDSKRAPRRVKGPVPKSYFAFRVRAARA
jgi:hypothetical protein